jgi:sialic acid synthase SpsE
LIEKHLILDSSVPSPDRLFAAEPKEMRAMVEEIRKVEQMLGTGIKEPVREEKAQRPLLRRCLMARRAILPGEVLSEEMISIKRPRPGQQGLPPSYFDQIIGLRVLRPIAVNEGITLEVFGPHMKTEER